MPAFEEENGVDGEGALREALRSLEKLEWDANDIEFFFNRCETRMQVANVKKQYTKFQVLSEILPKKVQDQVKSLLRKKETDFPNKDSYKQLKNTVLRIFGPRPEAAIERALGRTLTDKPSTLARELLDDICKHELNCDCCPSVVSCLWRRQLPTSVRAGIAHCKLTKESFEATIMLADDIFSTHHVVPQVAAAAVLDETQPAIPYPEVAAIRGGNRGGRGGGRGNRGNRGGRGGGRPQQPRGPKHPDLPPGDFKWCGMHHKWGKGSYFCAAPDTCPWRDVTVPRPTKQ